MATANKSCLSYLSPPFAASFRTTEKGVGALRNGEQSKHEALGNIGDPCNLNSMESISTLRSWIVTRDIESVTKITMKMILIIFYLNICC